MNKNLKTERTVETIEHKIILKNYKSIITLRKSFVIFSDWFINTIAILAIAFLILTIFWIVNNIYYDVKISKTGNIAFLVIFVFLFFLSVAFLITIRKLRKKWKSIDQININNLIKCFNQINKIKNNGIEINSINNNSGLDSKFIPASFSNDLIINGQKNNIKFSLGSKIYQLTHSQNNFDNSLNVNYTNNFQRRSFLIISPVDFKTNFRAISKQEKNLTNINFDYLYNSNITNIEIKKWIIKNVWIIKKVPNVYYEDKSLTLLFDFTIINSFDDLSNSFLETLVDLKYNTKKSDIINYLFNEYTRINNILSWLNINVD